LRFLDDWKERARELKKDVHALYLASGDRRVPWYARALMLCIIGYALSPIDLIPDFIPVLGLLDDLVLIPLGIVLVIKMIPPDVLSHYRQVVRAMEGQEKPRNMIAAAVIVVIWIIAGVVLASWAMRVVAGWGARPGVR